MKNIMPVKIEKYIKEQGLEKIAAFCPQGRHNKKSDF